MSCEDHRSPVRCGRIRLPDSTSEREQLRRQGRANAATLQCACQAQYKVMKQYCQARVNCEEEAAEKCSRQLLLLTQNVLDSQLRECESAERHMDSLQRDDPRLSEDELWLCEVADIPEELFQVVAALFSADLVSFLRKGYKKADHSLRSVLDFATQLQLAKIEEVMEEYDSENPLDPEDVTSDAASRVILRYKFIEVFPYFFSADDVEETARHLTNEADAHLSERNYEFAASLLSRAWTLLQKGAVKTELTQRTGVGLLSVLCMGVTCFREAASIVEQCHEIAGGAPEVAFLHEITQGAQLFEQLRFPEAKQALEAALQTGEGKGYSASSYWMAIHYLFAIYFDAHNFIPAAALVAKWSVVAPANGSPILSSLQLILQAVTKFLANSPGDAVALHERVRRESSLPWFCKGLNLRHLSRAYLLLGSLEEARAREKAREAKDKAREALEEAREAREKARDKARDALEEAYSIGRAHYCERVEFGQTLFDLALMESRGQHSNDLPRTREAQTYFQTHFPQSPHLAKLSACVGQMFFQTGRLPEAEKLLEESQRLSAFTSPSSCHAADALSMLARIYQKAQRPFTTQLEQAQAIYLATAPGGKFVMENYRLLGKAYMSEGRLDDALRVGSEAKKLVFQEIFPPGQYDAKPVSDLFQLRRGSRKDLAPGSSVQGLMQTYEFMGCFDLVERLVVRGMQSQQSGSWSSCEVRALYKLGRIRHECWLKKISFHGKALRKYLASSLLSRWQLLGGVRTRNSLSG